MVLLNGLIYVVCTTLRLLVEVLWFAILLRSLLSFLVMDEDAWYLRLLDALCEPALFPFRLLFSKLGWFENLPVDLSPLFAMVTLSILSQFLPVIPY